jgi:hypothetical protein
MTTLLTSLPLKTSFNQIGPVGELFGISSFTYLIASIAILATFFAIWYLFESDVIIFAGLVLFGLVGILSLYAVDNNYYTASGTLQSVNDYQSHQIVVFDDAKTFYTESGTDLSKSAGKQVTLTCRGRVGEPVNDKNLCKIDSVK